MQGIWLWLTEPHDVSMYGWMWVVYWLALPHLIQLGWRIGRAIVGLGSPRALEK